MAMAGQRSLCAADSTLRRREPHGEDGPDETGDCEKSRELSPPVIKTEEMECALLETQLAAEPGRAAPRGE